MKSIHIVIKATNACNLRCKYCYNSESQYGEERLSHERFEKMLFVLAKTYSSIRVMWHGGEPLYLGIDYYKTAMAIEEKVTRHTGVKITNAVQTNGTLMNKEWISFFKKYDFKPGLSFDGMNNDVYRQCSEKTLNAISLLQKNGMKFGCMAVVADDEYDILANYKFFAERSIPIEFSPVIKEGAAKDSNGISAERYAEEMIKLFDYWLYDKSGVDIRTFNSYFAMSMGYMYRVCSHNSCIGKYLGMAPDGTIYNCSRHSIQAYPYGNIDDIEDVSELFSSEGFKNLLIGSISRRKKCSARCEYFDYCGGGCPDVAITEGNLADIPETSCYCFKAVFDHVKKTVEKLKADGVPLTALNPSIKRALAKCTAIDGNLPENKIAEEYI